MTTGNFCFYLQNRLIQASQTGGQWYGGTSPVIHIGAMELDRMQVVSIVDCKHFRPNFCTKTKFDRGR